MADIRKKASHLEELYSNAVLRFDNCLRYFGEDPADAQARGSFFRKFSQFMKTYQDVRQFNVDREAQLQQVEKRKQVCDNLSPIFYQLCNRH